MGLLFGIIICIVGFNWIVSGYFQIVNPEQQNYRIIPGWELGSSLVAGGLHLLPLIIGILGLYIFIYGIRMIFGITEYFHLRKEWRSVLKELGIKTVN